jgi:hypothetical protein
MNIKQAKGPVYYILHSDKKFERFSRNNRRLTITRHYVYNMLRTAFCLEAGIYFNIPASASTNAYSCSLLHSLATCARNDNNGKTQKSFS